MAQDQLFDPFRMHPIRWIGMGCAVAEAVRGRAPESVLDYCYGGAAVYMGGHVVWAGVAAALRRDSLIDATVKTLMFDGFASFAIPMFITYTVKRLTRRAIQKWVPSPSKILIKWAGPCAALAALSFCMVPVDRALNMIINGNSIPVPRISPARLGKGVGGVFTPLGARGVCFDVRSQGIIRPNYNEPEEDESPQHWQSPQSPQPEAGDGYMDSPVVRERYKEDDGRDEREERDRLPTRRRHPRGCKDVSNVVNPDRYDEEIARRLQDRSPMRSPHASHLNSDRRNWDRSPTIRRQSSPRGDGWRPEHSPQQQRSPMLARGPQERDHYDDGYGDAQEDPGPDYNSMYGCVEDDSVFVVADKKDPDRRERQQREASPRMRREASYTRREASPRGGIRRDASPRGGMRREASVQRQQSPIYSQGVYSSR